MAEAEVVVIGGGPAGYVAARRLGQLGIETVLVEREHLGGVCLNRGCIPTKALYAATLPLGKKETYARMGLDLSARVDLPRLRGFLSEVVEKLRDGISRILAAAKVEVIFGEAKLTGPAAVEVEKRGSSEQIRAKAIVLATGSAPLELSFLPFDGARVWSSDHALTLPKIPEKLVVVGGGVVGLEIATIYRRLGSQVTVVEMMASLLPGLGLSRRGEAVLRQALTRQGIKVRLNTSAAGLTKNGVLVRSGTQEEEIEAETILVAVGRKPKLSKVRLETLGVQVENGFILTDERFQAARGIYAIGDVRGGALLAHKASHEGLVLGEILAAKIRGLPEPQLHKPTIPWAVFTQPEVAMVGVSVDSPALAVARFPFGALGRAWAEGEPEGFVNLAADKTGKIVGVEIIGPHASELIAAAALLVELGLSAKDLARTVHAHPTFAEALWEAALVGLGRPLHVL